MSTQPTGTKDPIHDPIHDDTFTLANPNRWWTLIAAGVCLFFAFTLPNVGDISMGLFLPIILYFLAGASVLAFFAFPKSKKRLRIFRNRVEVEKKNGEKQIVQMDEVTNIRSDRRFFYLRKKEKDTKMELGVGKGRKSKIQGLVELLMEHREALPAAVWERFFLGKEDLSHKKIQSQLRRVFLDESGTAAFLDQGIMVTSSGQNYYFPTSTTAEVVHPRAFGSVTPVLKQGQYNPIPRFEPDPARLPIQALAIALLEAQIPDDETHGALEALKEAHGGCQLTYDENEKIYTGEVAGYVIHVSLPKKGK